MVNQELAEIRSLLHGQVEALVSGQPELALQRFDMDDGNFPVMAQFFTVFATEMEVDRCTARVEARRRDDGGATNAIVFTLKVVPREHAPANFRFHYVLDRDSHGKLIVRSGSFGYSDCTAIAGPEALQVDCEPSGKRDLSAWFDERLADAARRAPDPHSITEYGRAAAARLRFLDVNPKLAAAVVLANMMSERVARVSRAIGPVDGDPQRTLTLLHRFHRGAVEHLENHPDADTAYVTFLNATYPTFDDACLYQERDGRAYAVCGGQALFNMAVLHLCGVGPDELLHVGLKSPFTIHEVLLWDSPTGPFLISNGYFEAWGPRHFYEMRQAYRACNCRWYADDRGAGNLSAETAARLATRFSGPFAHFDLQFLNRLKPAEGPTVGALRTGEPIPSLVRGDVWQRSVECPEGHETYAKYTSRSLLVRRPEAYLLHDTRSETTRRFATSLSTVGEIIDRLRQHVAGPSIYGEPDRVMQTEHVLRFGRGDRLDLNFALAALLRAQGVPCLFVRSLEDVAVTVRSGEDWRLLRAEGSDAAPLRGDVILAMNERSVFAPRLGRDDRSTDSDLATAVEYLSRQSSTGVMGSLA